MHYIHILVKSCDVQKKTSKQLKSMSLSIVCISQVSKFGSDPHTAVMWLQKSCVWLWWSCLDWRVCSSPHQSRSVFSRGLCFYMRLNDCETVSSMVTQQRKLSHLHSNTNVDTRTLSFRKSQLPSSAWRRSLEVLCSCLSDNKRHWSPKPEHHLQRETHPRPVSQSHDKGSANLT